MVWSHFDDVATLWTRRINFSCNRMQEKSSHKQGQGHVSSLSSVPEKRGSGSYIMLCKITSCSLGTISIYVCTSGKAWIKRLAVSQIERLARLVAGHKGRGRDLQIIIIIFVTARPRCSLAVRLSRCLDTDWINNFNFPFIRVGIRVGASMSHTGEQASILYVIRHPYAIRPTNS